MPFTFFFFFLNPCPSVTLLGLSSHPLLPQSICLLYLFLMLAPFALFPLFSSVIFTYFWFPSAMSDHLSFFILSPFSSHSNTPLPCAHYPASGNNFPSMPTFYFPSQPGTTSRPLVMLFLPTHLISPTLALPLSPLLFSLKPFNMTIAINSFLIRNANYFACSQFTLAFFCCLCPCVFGCRLSLFSTLSHLQHFFLSHYKAWQLFGYLHSTFLQIQFPLLIYLFLPAFNSRTDAYL